MLTPTNLLDFVYCAAEQSSPNASQGGCLIFDTFSRTWPMCFFSFLFFAIVAIVTVWFRVGSLDVRLPAGIVSSALLVGWLALSGVCLTLIDKPHFDMTPEMKDWLFMFSAFLGIPLTVPMMSGGIWALAHYLRREPVRLSSLSLVSLAGFALGCAASNIHDIAWCGVITSGYTQHFKAGYDLDIFVAFGQMFGIPREALADYATLGPYTMVLVAGELLVAMTALWRLRVVFDAEKD